MLSPRAQTGPPGLREPAWSPDGKRLAVVVLDRIWTMQPDGHDGSELTRSPGSEREPAWSPDGKRIAFVADHGDGFDLYIVNPRGGTPERVAMLDGDQRWPSWTPEGRLVFAHRASDTTQWDLFLIDPDLAAERRVPLRLTQSQDDEMQPRVSPDGRRVAFTSNRGNDDGDFDIWVMRLLDKSTPDEAGGRGPAVRFERQAGYEGYPAWSPDGSRLAYYAVRDGVGSTWVANINALTENTSAASRPLALPVLASRHGGTVAWSPDGHTLAIGEVPELDQVYNGNPQRERSDPPALFAAGHGYQLWTVPAPRAVDEGGRPLAPSMAAPPASLTRAFDTVWLTLKRLYYDSGSGSRQWDALRAEFRPRAEQARTPAALEDIVDRMVADQPLVKPEVTSSRAVVVSGHPLASQVGRDVLERGGNIVDAAIAVSFALGVVEPDASGIGGDGQAVLYLKGMPEPTVVEFKDQTPRAATLDTPGLLKNGRLVSDGPLSINIPGVVAGLDYLHTKYGSGRMGWSELIAPAIGYAEDGFVLDATLPSSVAEGRQSFQKYSAAARIFLPNGRVPRTGDRFVNRDYGTTLRTIAADGATAFYRGAIARRIAADMSLNGGLITESDLAQYRAIERKPVSGRYRGYVLYTGGPPVGVGVNLLEALQVLGSYDPRRGATFVRDADYLHYMIESWKVRDRITRIADPGQWAVDYEDHLKPAHAADLFARIHRQTAARFSEDSEEVSGGPERIGSGTSGFVIADTDGNMIAVTQTLSTWGGSFYVTRGLGFLYNNHLRANRTTPGAYGQLMPLTRSSTANLPILAFRDQDGQQMARLAVASAGNAWIPASTYSIVTAVLDGEMSMQRAIEAPRFLVTRDPADASGVGARVEIEDRFPRAVIQDLTARGHRFQKIGRKGELKFGYASGVLVDIAKGRVEGGADPRRSHSAVAVETGSGLSQ
ncbi:MAG TPA: gamma-glutamyltransferase [Vicinamibacterales bacterium]|nr:gamma-glutamyltransferase [Vicinamibacterales bacterium]